LFGQITGKTEKIIFEATVLHLIKTKGWLPAETIKIPRVRNYSRRSNEQIPSHFGKPTLGNVKSANVMVIFKMSQQIGERTCSEPNGVEMQNPNEKTQG
jgi:hypothetical protein